MTTVSDFCNTNILLATDKPQLVSSIMIISQATSSGVTYDGHSDDCRGIIYKRNMFIVEVTVFDFALIETRELGPLGLIESKFYMAP